MLVWKPPRLEKLCLQSVGNNLGLCLLAVSGLLLCVVGDFLSEEVSKLVLKVACILCSVVACGIVIATYEVTDQLTQISGAIQQLSFLSDLEPMKQIFSLQPHEVTSIHDSFASLVASLRIAKPYIATAVLDSLQPASGPIVYDIYQNKGNAYAWGASSNGDEDDEEEDEEEESLLGNGYADSNSSNDIFDKTCPVLNGTVAQKHGLLEIDVMSQSGESFLNDSSPRSTVLRMVGEMSFASPSRRNTKRRGIAHLGESSGEETDSEDVSTVCTMQSPAARPNAQRTLSISGRGSLASSMMFGSPKTKGEEVHVRGGRPLPRYEREEMLEHNLISPKAGYVRRLPSCRDALLALTKASFKNASESLRSDREDLLAMSLAASDNNEEPHNGFSRQASRRLISQKSDLSCRNEPLSRGQSLVGFRGRRPSCRDALEALKTSSMRNMQETATKIDSQPSIKMGPRDAMVKRKGTLLSVEFGIMELADDNTHDTYALASSLVSVVLDIIQQESGNVFQLRADGLIASWNTHHACARHGWYACRAALEIRKAMEAVEDPKDRVGWSVSIASGNLYCGNIGNDEHKSPFVLGSVLDDCRRLNELSRVLQTPIIISEAVQDVCTMPDMVL